MIVEEKRTEALKLIHTLYELAANLGMKLRILDSIKACETALEGDDSETSWVQAELQLDEIIRYMEKEILGEAAVVVNDDVSVSKEDIKKRIMEIWSRGRAGGVESVSAYQTGGMSVLEKIKRDMTDLTNADANYHILSVPAAFESRCIQMSQNYGQKVEALAIEYLEEACERYEQAMKQIKGLVGSIDRGQVTITARDIYEKWDSRQELCRQKLKETAAGTDNGKGLLSQFGREQVEPLRRIKKKNQRKRSLYTLLPVLLIVVCILGSKLISVIPEITSSNKQESTEAQESSSSGSSDSISDIFSMNEEDLAILASQGVDATNVLEFIEGNILEVIGVIALIIIAYYLWIMYVKKRYRRWMVNETGTYIAPKIGEFLQKDELKTAKDTYFQEISQNVQSCYESLFHDVFGDTFTNGEIAPSENIKNVRMEWNRIKNMR